MPSNIVKSFAKKTGKSVKEVDKLWNKASKEAKKMGQEDNFAYITEILKTMLGLDESIESFTDNYIKSGKKFNEFYETTISSDYSEVPEIPIKKKKDDKDDEEMEKIIVGLEKES